MCVIKEIGRFLKKGADTFREASQGRYYEESEAIDELKKETFRIDAPRMPNGGPESTLHMAITDETGNTAVLEYLDGKLSIHEGKEYQVMTNFSPI